MSRSQEQAKPPRRSTTLGIEPDTPQCRGSLWAPDMQAERAVVAGLAALVWWEVAAALVVIPHQKTWHQFVTFTIGFPANRDEANHLAPNLVSGTITET